MSRNLTEPISLKLPKWPEPNLSNVTVGNRRLSLEEVARVARCGTRVRLNDESDVVERVQASCDYIADAVVMTGIAPNCVRDSQVILALAMGTHALTIQGLGGTNQSFHPFIHKLK